MKDALRYVQLWQEMVFKEDDLRKLRLQMNDIWHSLTPEHQEQVRDVLHEAIANLKKRASER